jgi:hypothetical protein
MKRKDAIRMMWSTRAEAYLRMRYAYLTQRDAWADAPADGPPPAAVDRTLDAVCLGCLNDAITSGDWNSIDPILMGDSTALPDKHLH